MKLNTNPISRLRNSASRVGLIDVTSTPSKVMVPADGASSVPST